MHMGANQELQKRRIYKGRVHSMQVTAYIHILNVYKKKGCEMHAGICSSACIAAIKTSHCAELAGTCGAIKFTLHMKVNRSELPSL